MSERLPFLALSRGQSLQKGLARVSPAFVLKADDYILLIDKIKHESAIAPVNEAADASTVFLGHERGCR